MAKQKLKVLPGTRFGHLVVIREARRADRTKRRFLVSCDCGNQAFALLEKLRQKRTTSCGCRHGGKPKLRHDPLRNIWAGMLRRCADLDDANYGGKGIRVCDQWHDFKNFRDWAIKTRWKAGLSIDRENSGGNYCPTNCRWLTLSENKSRRQFFDGAAAALALPN